MQYQFDSSSESDDECDSHPIDLEEMLYDGAQITLEQFRIAFLLCCTALNLCFKHRHMLLIFLKSILPCSNKVPRSYRMLTKDLFNQKPKKRLICSFCCKELSTGSTCLDCQRQTKRKPFDSPTSTVFEYDLVEQLKHLIKKQISTIKTYLGEFF